MTDRLRSSYERDGSPYTKKTGQSAVLSAIGQVLNSGYEVPQRLPRELITLLEQFKITEER